MRDKIVLVVDGGGRGSVLVHKYSQSPKVKKIIAVPGNDLMKLNSAVPVKTYQNLKTTSVREILEICKKEKVDLVDVSQDEAVEAGLTDELLAEGIRVCGPTKFAGQIEWDKAWSRDFMKKYNLPIPVYQICSTEAEGIKFIKKQKEGKWFIKASGLAGGKGALPAENNKQAISRIKEMKKFGKSGQTFVIEEWLEGEEFSMFALSDGETYRIIGSAQDHKRMYNFDRGENTGGMGCSSPPLVVTPRIIREVDKNIFSKTFQGLKREGRVFKGVLYLGGIIVSGKVYVIEFNARWGDPEAEVIVPGIKGDLYRISEAIAEGKLRKVVIKNDQLTRVVVTLALRENPNEGRIIYGIPEALRLKNITLYGTRISIEGKKYLAGSGRLLHIVGEGRNIIEAREKAYLAASLLYIEGNNSHFRTDIGWRDLERFHSGKKN